MVEKTEPLVPVELSSIQQSVLWLNQLLKENSLKYFNLEQKIDLIDSLLFDLESCRKVLTKSKVAGEKVLVNKLISEITELLRIVRSSLVTKNEISTELKKQKPIKVSQPNRDFGEGINPWKHGLLISTAISVFLSVTVFSGVNLFETKQPEPTITKGAKNKSEAEELKPPNGESKRLKLD